MERSLDILDKLIAASLFTFAAFSLFSISVTQISAAVGIVAWLAKVHLTQSWKEVRIPLWIPLSIFIFACILAVITAVDPGGSVKSLKKLLLILIFFWVLNAVKDGRQRDALFFLLFAAAIVSSLYGFYQGWLTGISKSTRVHGTMSIYMTFAGLLMLVGLLSLGRFFFRQPREKWLLAGVALIVICLLLTLTRQAWLGFLVGSIFLMFVWNRLSVLVLSILVVLTFLLSSGAVKERLNSMIDLKDRTLQIRLLLWQGGWRVFKDHPITGCGFKCIDRIHKDYPDPEGAVAKYIGMHNNIVQLAVDTGVVGLTSWIAIWVCYFLALRRMWTQNKENPDQKWVVLGSAGAVLGFLAGGLFEVNFYDSEVVMLLYFIMALPLIEPDSARPQK